MKAFTIQGVFVAAIIAAALCGCNSNGKPRIEPGSLTAAMASVAPQYTAQASIIDGLLFGKAKAEAEAKSPASDLAAAKAALIAAGYNDRMVYRYKGTVCDKSDLSRETIFQKTDTGDAVFDDAEPAKPSDDFTPPAEDPVAGDAIDYEALAAALADSFAAMSNTAAAASADPKSDAKSAKSEK